MLGIIREGLRLPIIENQTEKNSHNCMEPGFFLGECGGDPTELPTSF